MNHTLILGSIISLSLLNGCGSNATPTGTGASGATGTAGTTSTTGTAGTAGNGLTGSTPADGSQAAIAAYLQAETYKQSPWKSETVMPREASSPVSPHGRVRVWMNDTLVSSLKAGNGEFGGLPHIAGSMAVKEFYDASDVRLGTAAMLKLPGADAWRLYCNSTVRARCGVQATLPFYADETDLSCNGCHGGLIFNKAP
jgi:hypothetical protein